MSKSVGRNGEKGPVLGKKRGRCSSSAQTKGIHPLWIRSACQLPVTCWLLPLLMALSEVEKRKTKERKKESTFRCSDPARTFLFQAPRVSLFFQSIIRPVFPFFFFCFCFLRRSRVVYIYIYILHVLKNERLPLFLCTENSDNGCGPSSQLSAQIDPNTFPIRLRSSSRLCRDCC